MQFYIGVTDNQWYDFLAARKPEDVNFWQPGGKVGFKALQPGGPFLFKLKSPRNAIAGVGFFSTHSFLPIPLAWDAFGEHNGCASQQDLQLMIQQYRQDNTPNPQIGCIILSNPVFFAPDDWIETPFDWSPNIVSGKTYSTQTAIGQNIWELVESRLSRYLSEPAETGLNDELSVFDAGGGLYNQVLAKVRLGQGAFRIMVTDAYQRRCAISGEKTLPVLEAAHIKPYAARGPSRISNALLLRADIHKLFDSGYLTVTPDFKVEVSRRIREEFSNGKDYYAFHGQDLKQMPGQIYQRPEKTFVEWHNSNVYLG